MDNKTEVDVSNPSKPTIETQSEFFRKESPVEVITIMQGETPMIVSSADFGSGETGRAAFSLIKRGIKCEAVNSDGTPCDFPAIRTLDEDAVSKTTSHFVCSDQHAAVIQTIIEGQMVRQQKPVSFSKNGNGRP